MKQNNRTSNQANKSKERDATDSLKKSGEQQKGWKSDSAQQRVLDEGEIETKVVVPIFLRQLINGEA